MIDIIRDHRTMTKCIQYLLLMGNNKHKKCWTIAQIIKISNGMLCLITFACHTNLQQNMYSVGIVY